MTETSSTSASETPRSGGGMRRIVLLTAGGFILFIVLVFALAVVLALTTSVEHSATVIRLIRDLVIIFLAVEGALIVLSLAILILQVAQLIHLLQSELKPILQNTQETVKTAQGTVQFVSQTVTEPIVKAGGFLAALAFFLSNWFGLLRAIRKTKVQATDEKAAEQD